jgi:hypothetical protein
MIKRLDCTSGKITEIKEDKTGKLKVSKQIDKKGKEGKAILVKSDFIIRAGKLAEKDKAIIGFLVTM